MQASKYPDRPREGPGLAWLAGWLAGPTILAWPGWPGLAGWLTWWYYWPYNPIEPVVPQEYFSMLGPVWACKP